MQRLQIETPEHVVLDFEVAGVGSRALAAVIDLAILGGLGFAIVLTVGTLFGVGLASGPWAAAVLVFLLLLGWWLYYIAFEGLRRGQTPGKRIVGIRVVSRETGGPIGLRAAVHRAGARDLFWFISFLALGDPLLRPLHDRSAGTVVINADASGWVPPPRLAGF